MNRVYVLDKKSFDTLMKTNGINDSTVESFKKTFFISIVDPITNDSVTCGTKESSTSYFKNDHDNVLRLSFHDVDNPDILKKYPDVVMFSDDDARKIIEFLKKIHIKGVEDYTIIIHCIAGISRSAAVGTFAVDYLGLDYNDFKSINKYLSPNTYVMKKLKQWS